MQREYLAKGQASQAACVQPSDGLGFAALHDRGATGNAPDGGRIAVFIAEINRKLQLGAEEFDTVAVDVGDRPAMLPRRRLVGECQTGLSTDYSRCGQHP